MIKYQAVLIEDSIDFKGTADVLHEYLEEKFESQFGFCPMFQESEDEGYLEVYLHTDTYKILGAEELAKLDELKILESDSLQTICLLLSIRIEHWDEDEIATCGVCGKDYHESKINMIDYDDDVCLNCLQQYKETLKQKQ
jgi:hypothetical protein